MHGTRGSIPQPKGTTKYGGNTSCYEVVTGDFQIIFDQNGPNLLLTRGATIKTGILTPIEFWWIP